MSGLYDNRRARFDIQGGPRTASAKNHHWRRAAAARRVLPGYPIDTPFSDPEEVWEYLKGDRITCLRCGKTYKSLGVHLGSIHGWTDEQYRLHYGLPWRTGLTCAPTKAIQSAGAKKKYLEGRTFPTDKASRAAALKLAHAAPRRKRAPYLRAVAMMNVMHTRTRDRARVEAGEFKVWRDEDYWAVVERAKEQDRSPAEVSTDEDLPGASACAVFRRSNPEFAKAYEAIWEALSFSTQARGEHLGDRFRTAAGVLRRAGKTAKEIGQELGVHGVTVEKHIAGVVPVPEKTHCPQGHPYPAGPKVCKICNLESKRRSTGTMARAESAKTMITVACSWCGAAVVRSRLSGRRRKVRCEACKRDYHKAYEARRRDG